MIRFMLSLLRRNPAPASCEMADEIGFHAIWDKRFHDVRPATLAGGSPDVCSGPTGSRSEFVHIGLVHPFAK